MSSAINISVVVPVYNRGTTIRRCLESVFGQTVSPYEIIVVDDGSTDNTASVVRSIGDERLRLIAMPSNRGAQAARNVGIANARGNYIAFLDSDDEWLPEKLELQVREIAEGQEPRVIHGGALTLTEGQRARRPFPVPKLDGSVYKDLLSRPGPLYPCLLVPKRCFEEIGFLDEQTPSYQEWDTCIALARKFDFVFVDKPLMIYHTHGGETISRDRIREAKGWQYVVEKYKAEMLHHIGRTALARHYERIATLYLRAGDLARAKKWFYAACVTDYWNVLLLAKALVAFSWTACKRAIQRLRKGRTEKGLSRREDVQ